MTALDPAGRDEIPGEIGYLDISRRPPGHVIVRTIRQNRVVGRGGPGYPPACLF
jgi:hypothetical protein